MPNVACCPSPAVTGRDTITSKLGRIYDKVSELNDVAKFVTSKITDIPPSAERGKTTDNLEGALDFIYMRLCECYDTLCPAADSLS